MSLDQYRKNVAAIVQNSDKLILVGHRRRSFSASAWQLPQGGIKGEESAEEAIGRELFEETGLGRYQILGKSSGWICYNWPKGHAKGEKYLGQRQIYFALQVESVGMVDLRESEELDQFEWVDWQKVMARVVSFKREAYLSAYSELKNYLAI